MGKGFRKHRAHTGVMYSYVMNTSGCFQGNELNACGLVSLSIRLFSSSSCHRHFFTGTSSGGVPRPHACVSFT